MNFILKLGLVLGRFELVCTGPDNPLDHARGPSFKMMASNDRSESCDQGFVNTILVGMY